MQRHARRAALVALGHWLLAAYFAVSQPGLCLCGLIGQPPFTHLHGHSSAGDPARDEDHPHTDLLVLLRANAASTVTPHVEDAMTLLLRLQSGLTLRLRPDSPPAQGWQPPLEPPPPRQLPGSPQA